MFKWVLRSGLVGMVLLATFGVVTVRAFNWTEVDNTIRRGADTAIRAGQIGGDGIDQATDTSGGRGGGFYMAIYEETVRNPNRLAEEKIKERFGINFKIDLAPVAQQGQFLFTDFFENPGSSLKNPVVPVLQDTLQSDCVRIRTAQADDEIRRWDIVKRRITELQQAAETAPEEVTNREILLRLGDTIDQEMSAQVRNALANIPEYSSLNSQDILLRCYQDISAAVDFEFRLQSILNSSRRQLEAMQTFINGRLDDFTQSVPFSNISYGTAFPQYDLLFDIDVIDMIFFGSPVATSSGIASGGDSTDGSGNARPFGDYAEIQAVTSPEESTSSTTGGDSSIGSSSGTVGGSTSTGTTSLPTSDTVATGSGFGTSSRDFAGPMCTELQTGLDLNYSGLDSSGTTPLPAATAPSSSTTLPPSSTSPTFVAPPATGTGEPRDSSTDILTEEGTFDIGKNRKAVCEGTFGVNFGTDMLKLFFCIDIRFSKLGKTWQSTPQENCIACHLAGMNKTFDELFKSSLRPHKNTGTIMESGICEDGYGDDVGFFSFIELVPVKFYPPICYPQGGVTPSQYAELVGYPELIARANKKDFEVKCDRDFYDEDAVKRCREALNGSNLLTYSQLRDAYRGSINVEDPIQSLGDVDEDNIWVRLAGHQGVVERELHLFLYRLGKVPGQLEEGKDEGGPVEQDFKAQLDYLAAKMMDLQKSDLSEERRLEQLMCLKGTFYQQEGSRTLNCARYDFTLKEVEARINAERDRIANLTARWNARSRDFNQENECSTFSGSGIIDALEQEDFIGRFSLDYYLETDTRRAQSPAEQVTRQIADNTEIDDLNRLFSAINLQLESIAVGQTEEQLKKEFQSQQEKSLQYFSAFGVELTSFRSILSSYTGWWEKMLNDKQFVSKGGQRVSVIESFFEKLR